MYRPFRMSTLYRQADVALLDAVEAGLEYAVTHEAKGKATVCSVGLYDAAQAACNAIIGAELIEYRASSGGWQYAAKAA